jgi:hypothetical protein
LEIELSLSRPLVLAAGEARSGREENDRMVRCCLSGIGIGKVRARAERLSACARERQREERLATSGNRKMKKTLPYSSFFASSFFFALSPCFARKQKKGGASSPHTFPFSAHRDSSHRFVSRDRESAPERGYRDRGARKKERMRAAFWLGKWARHRLVDDLSIASL